MPLIDCKLINGYTEQTRKLLSERITDAACSSTGAAPEFVTVTIAEISPNNYMRGRTQKIPATAPMQSDKIVLNYLKAMESRNLKLANSFIGDNFQITCPGNEIFNSLEDFLSWGKVRYRKIGKEISSLDLSFNGLEAYIYCHGTLNGEWLSGKPFKGIRFIDKFQTFDSKIISQEIWNDLDLMKET
jgi:phenylpyruvate tautomerase PptA (4-oxalocrotonate tautomerase family)